MAKEKQYVFSARTTETGLKTLNELKGKLKASWDEMVIDAVCEKYNLQKEMMALPKKEKPAKQAGRAEQLAEEKPPAKQKAEETVKNQIGKRRVERVPKSAKNSK